MIPLYPWVRSKISSWVYSKYFIYLSWQRRGIMLLSEELLYSVKIKLRKTLIYLHELAKDTNDGYFHLDMDQCVSDLGISERTIYYHLDKFNEKNIVFRVYKGTRNPNGLALNILRDAGKTIKGIGSLYYFPGSVLDSPLEKDMAVLRYCFGWQEEYIRHYQRWCDAENLSYDTPTSGDNGFSKATEEHLLQFFKYMVNGEFDWNHRDYDCYMDRFERLIA